MIIDARHPPRFQWQSLFPVFLRIPDIEAEKFSVEWNCGAVLPSIDHAARNRSKSSEELEAPFQVEAASWRQFLRRRPIHPQLTSDL
jgi:hypothetical protein